MSLKNPLLNLSGNVLTLGNSADSSNVTISGVVSTEGALTVSAGNLTLNTGNIKLTTGGITSNGNVLIGAKEYPVNAPSGASSVPLYVATTTSTYSLSGTIATSIAAAGAINSTTAFIQGSDRRIKTNIESIRDCDALGLLEKFEPRTYSLVDASKNYLSKTYGFVAQEVESVLPEAASPMVDFVPNIYELADVVDDSCYVIKLRNKSTCDFEKDASGNIFTKLKCYDCCNNEFLSEIESIIDDKTFRVLKPISSVLGSIFIYGQEVDNFKCLDKNVIFTVTTAAAAALHRIVQTQKTEIDSLKRRLEYIESLLIGNV